MFMFRKKDNIKSTSTGLGKEAKKFQKAYKELFETIKPEEITIKVIEAFADRHDIDIEILKEALDANLRKNAIASVRKVKASNDYTVLNLEQAVSNYGFEIDDLNITFFSEE